MSSSRSRPSAFVTGASSGIGTAYAERLRAETETHAGVLVADLSDAHAVTQLETRIAGDGSLATLAGRYQSGTA